MSEPAGEIEGARKEAAGLPVLANRANEAHRAALDAARSALEYGRDAGETSNERRVEEILSLVRKGAGSNGEGAVDDS